MNDYQQYIATSRYARWREEDKRRETWEETVDRYTEFLGVDSDIGDAIKSLDVMPSMRLLMTAGVAAERDNIAAYNCAYTPIDNLRAFDESMYILMCGTGVGFSVERQFINKLPEINEDHHDTETTILVRDSKKGWAKAFKELVSMLYAGSIPRWDVSKVRPAGARLKTFGGRASGPEPLVDLFNYTVGAITHAAGRRLTSLECHDLMCKMASVVVVGGVRRSALISLSNLTDERMRDAKRGQWWDGEGHRALANNSVCYTEKPDIGIFMREWTALYKSKSGERGVFNREAARLVVERNGRRDPSHEFGCNPCSEIILRPNQFCNLTEVVVRPNDTFDVLKDKVRMATILGTLQSTLTDFKYIRKVWTTNTEEERLLGVSLTGIMDHKELSHVRKEGGKNSGWYLPNILQELKDVAIQTNKEWADKLGIPASTAITCVKPSGTVSQLVDSASGIHPRYSDYYIRTVRTDKKDPLYGFLIREGVRCDDDVTNPSTTGVFSFPTRAPRSSVKRDDRGALEQLELWKVYATHWCEHKPSITVYVREDEWLKVGAWVYENFDICSGVSFLPHDNGTYRQAPYQELTKEAYDEAVKLHPKKIDWSTLSDFENEDNTSIESELACSAGGCDIL
jgi:ribonucleoside-diphosphate reductase alpha chain